MPLARLLPIACAVSLLAACAPAPQDPVLDLEGIDGIEAQFGEGCRSVVDPEPLLTFLAELPDDWQGFWTDAPTTAFHLTLSRNGQAALRLGLGGGSMILERAGGERVFRAVSETEASRLVDLAGGVPLGDELEVCSLADAELAG